MQNIPLNRQQQNTQTIPPGAKKKSDIYIRIKEKGAVSIERSAGPDRGLSRRRTESPLGTHHVDEPLNRSEKAASV